VSLDPSERSNLNQITFTQNLTDLEEISGHFSLDFIEISYILLSIEYSNRNLDFIMNIFSFQINLNNWWWQAASG